MADQYQHSTEMQIRTRKERGFEQAESDLPSVSASSRISMLWARDNLLNDVLSYLGTRNPFPRSVTAEDTVWLLDNTAFRNPQTGGWEAEFVSATFAQHPTCHVADAVAAVAKKLDMKEDDPDYPTIQERIVPFVQDIRPATQVDALHNGATKLKLGPAGRNGITSDLKTLPDKKSTALLVPTFAQVPSGANGVLEMKTFYAEPEGWGVISDIDDTIKVTMTSDPIGILKSTFIDTPTPIAGMPELYAYIQALIGETSPFFYLSASPYNLYPFLRDFRQQNYPHGTIVLRDSSWMSIPGLLSQLTLGTGEHKVDRMQKINSWIPRRKMICIGDSTQADPESYGTIYRQFPGWVQLVLIRKVTDIASIGIDAKNKPERFEAAFQGVPRDRWHVFETPEECSSIIHKVFASQQH